MTSQRTYKYYNSNYYYKTEEALAAITDRYTSLIQEAGWEDQDDHAGFGRRLKRRCPSCLQQSRKKQ